MKKTLIALVLSSTSLAYADDTTVNFGAVVARATYPFDCRPRRVAVRTNPSAISLTS